MSVSRQSQLGSQYSLAKIRGVRAIVTLLMAILSWIVAPTLVVKVQAAPVGAAAS
jgi:hypothetical protein